MFKGVRFSTSSDIFSVGIILWELVERLLAGQYSLPYSEYKWIQFDFQIIVQASEKTLRYSNQVSACHYHRPTIHASCPAIFNRLIEACWHADQNSRPSATDVLQALQRLKVSVVLSAMLITPGGPDLDKQLRVYSL